MTISSAARLLSYYGSIKTRYDNYAIDQIDEIITSITTTSTEYNAIVWGVGPAVTAGAIECKFGTVGNWWPGGVVDTDGIDIATVQYWIDAYNADPTGFPFIIDIEAWYIRTQTEKTIEQLSLAASMWRDQTDREIGIFAYIPYHGQTTVTDLIKAAVDDGTDFTYHRAMAMLAREMHLNDYVNSRLGPLVDFYVPRCYMYTDGEDVKHKYEVAQQIIEAKRLANGKPVYPIWWHSSLEDGYPNLSESSFLESVKFITQFSGIAGSIAWTGGAEPNHWSTHLTNLINLDGEFVPTTAIRFNGTSDGLSHEPITDIGTNDFFVDMFVQVDELPSANLPIYQSRSTGTGFNIQIGSETNNEEIRVHVANSGTIVGNHPSRYLGRTLQTGMWTYIHLSFDRDGYLNMYVDNPTEVNAARSITAWTSLDLVQTLNPCYLGRTNTPAYMACRVAYMGIGIGSLLTDEERTTLYNNGYGLATASLPSGILAKFDHRWDLGSDITDLVGSVDFSPAPSSTICAGPSRKQEIYASTYGFRASDSTTALQRSLDSGARRVIVDLQPSGWITSPLYFRTDNQTLICESGVNIAAKSGEFTRDTDCLFSATNRTNISIDGNNALWSMNKTEYPTDSEYRMGLKLIGCSGVTVENLTIKDCGGDGIYVGNILCQNITIRNVVCQNNNRNNISVTDVDGLLIEDVVLIGASGTSPEAGIDFEPNNASDIISNVVLRRVTTENNNKCGFFFELRNITSASGLIDILCEDCMSSGDARVSSPDGRGGLWIACNNADAPSGNILIDSMTINDTVTKAVTLRSKTPSGPTVELRDCVINNPAALIPTSSPVRFSAASDDTVDNGGYILTNLQINDSVNRNPIDYYDDTDTDSISWSDISGNLLVSHSGIVTEYELTTEQLQEWISTYTETPPPL